MSENKGVVAEILERVPEEKKATIVNNCADVVVNSTGSAVIVTQGLIKALRGTVWGVEKASDFISQYCPQKLKNVPAEKIVQPALEIAGPAVQALMFRGEQKELRELFGNLIASSMNADQKDKVHPSFVEIIKNMSADEAKIMKLFVKQYEYPAGIYPTIILRAKRKEDTSFVDVINNYSHLGRLAECTSFDVSHNLENLNRLGLLELKNDASMKDNALYLPLENDPHILKKIEEISQIPDHKHQVDRGGVKPTNFGELFIECCIL